jgi:hypothetical protein
VQLDVDLGAQAADLAFGEYPGIPIALTDRRTSAWRARTHACFPTALQGPPLPFGRGLRLPNPLGAVLLAPRSSLGRGAPTVLLKDKHEGYISWGRVREESAGDCQCNQQGKRHRQRSGAARGAADRRPSALWPLQSQNAYGGKAGRYHCEGAVVTMARSAAPRSAACGPVMPSARRCCGEPLGIDAAVKAINAQTHETSAAQRQLELSLQQARYEAAHARRQYDAVDPANRLVAGELERRWNEARQVVHRIEGEIAAIEARKPVPLSEVGRQQLMQPGADLALAWSYPATTSATRNRGGKPTGRATAGPRRGCTRSPSHHGIIVHREREWAERSEITLAAAAQIMDVNVMTALRMVRHGIIKGRQVRPG